MSKATGNARLIAPPPAPRLVPIAGGVAPAQDSPAERLAREGQACARVLSAGLAQSDPAVQAQTLAAVGQALLALAMAVNERAEDRPQLNLVGVGGDAA